ncbi:MAG: sigma-70 family RNA polymerase sigma factor [Thermoanaerobaculia bacterium]|nr:sigma-70 family RNA polymerase sigma factor [Thermoanaerobaculia bacterium]
MTVTDAGAVIGDTKDPDAELMLATSRGDARAFALLVDRHKNGLVNYLTHLTSDRDRAEELAQEAFVRLYEKADRYDERGKLTSYLYSIATNLVRSEQRRKARWFRLVPRLSVHLSREDPGPQRGLLSDEATREVRRALEQLPIHFRAPVILREIEGWSYQDIAAALQCNVGTIKSRINRARRRLRDLLEDYWTERGEE